MVFGKEKVHRVGFKNKDHVDRKIVDNDGRVIDLVVEEHVVFQIYVFGGGRLLWGYFMERCIDTWVNVGIVK